MRCRASTTLPGAERVAGRLGDGAFLLEDVDAPSRHLEVLATGRFRVEAGPLPHDPDRAPHAVGVANDVETRNARLAAVRAVYTDEQLELLTGFLRESVAFQEDRLQRLEEIKEKAR